MCVYEDEVLAYWRSLFSVHGVVCRLRPVAGVYVWGQSILTLWKIRSFKYKIKLNGLDWMVGEVFDIRFLTVAFFILEQTVGCQKKSM